jgi:hypothetical protein
MRNYTWTIIGLILLITAGVAAWIIWPIFIAPSDAPPPSVEQLDEIAEGKPFVDVTLAAGFTHVHQSCHG